MKDEKPQHYNSGVGRDKEPSGGSSRTVSQSYKYASCQRWSEPENWKYVRPAYPQNTVLVAGYLGPTIRSETFLKNTIKSLLLLLSTITAAVKWSEPENCIAYPQNTVLVGYLDQTSLSETFLKNTINNLLLLLVTVTVVAVKWNEPENWKCV